MVDISTRPSGRLTCVGVGMMLGAHLAPRAKREIEQADVVFAAVSDALVEAWLRPMCAEFHSLQVFYREGKSRHQTYHEMVDAILGELRNGRRVCAAFYGHPGVFAKVGHDAIERARAEGFAAVMEAGISAEDCLYADLGIDPGRFGCQHYEASQLLFYRRVLDPSAYLVLWQAGVAGDRSYTRFATGQAYREVLVDRLLEDYPATHPVVIYEAATLPFQQPRSETLPLHALVGIELPMQATLVLRPARDMQPDARIRERLALLDAAAAA